MKISVVIINFNTPQLTLNCLRSIKQHWDTIQYEIILVDNAPKADHKADFLSVDDRISYIISEVNIGFGRANNLGMKAATGKYLLLLNSDTLIFDDSIAKCTLFLEQPENAGYGMLGCRLLNEDLSHQNSFYPFVHDSLWNYFKCNNPFLYKLYDLKKEYADIALFRQVGDVSGACMLLRKEVFDTTGGFDPDFFLYCEETEWCRNRVAKQYKIGYFPESSVVHLGGQSAPQTMMQVQSFISLGLYWYKSGRGKLPVFVALNFLNAFFYALSYPFTDAAGRQQVKLWLRRFSLSLPYWVKVIPQFPRGFAKRREGLIYAAARPLFFGSKL